MRIAYFVNQYPKVSHSFIRREILALERQGFHILRIALRGWDGEFVDEEDEKERARTAYVLRYGISVLLWALLQALLTTPGLFCSALALAIRIGWRAHRPLPYHLAYFAEACRMLPWLKSFGAAHVHAHFGTNSAEVVMLAHALGGPPYSFTVHGPEEFDKAQLLGIGEKVRRAAFVVAISSYCRSQLYRWVEHAHWAKVKVVHCGLETAFHAVEATPPPAAPRLVCVGRLCEQKGQLLLVEAVHRLARKDITFELVLAGDGEMRSEVEALIEKHALEQQVRITGWISSDQVREEILAARALVLPSFAEGLPVVIMEAMALRRPVLATYVAGIPELVRPGEDGWLFPAGDVDELAAAMQDCLSRSVSELQVMGAAAHARVLEHHSIDTAAAELAGLFRQAAGGAVMNTVDKPESTGSEETKRFYDRVGWQKQDDQVVDLRLFGVKEDGPIRIHLHRVHTARVRSALKCAGDRIKLLECGCGGSPATNLLDLCSEYTGVDFSQVGLKEANEQLEGAAIPCDLRLADVCKLPFDDDRFDAVYSAHMLYHIPYAAGQRSALDEMLRVLRPGGVLVLITANPRPLLFPVRALRRLVADTPGVGRIADFVRRKPPLPYRPMPLGWIRGQVMQYGSVELATHGLPSTAFNQRISEYSHVGRQLWRLMQWLDLTFPRASAYLGNYAQVTVVKSAATRCTARHS